MLVEVYFDSLEDMINDCGYIQSKTMTRDIRSDFVGFFEADLYFHDGSVLSVREFVFTKIDVIKDMYAYHYQDSNGQLIVRYDNTRHFPHLPNFPHHKHLPVDVISAEEMGLADVLREIVNLSGGWS